MAPTKKTAASLQSAAELRLQLRESPELMTLAQEAIRRRRLQGEVEFSDSWVEKLADDLVRFND